MTRRYIYILASLVLIGVISTVGYSVFLNRAIDAAGQPSQYGKSIQKSSKPKPFKVASVGQPVLAASSAPSAPKTVGSRSLIDASDDRDKTIGSMIRATISHPKGQVIVDKVTFDKVQPLIDTAYGHAKTDDYGKYHMDCRDGYPLNYRLYRPVTAPNRKYPLVVYLHGAGGKMHDDNVSQMCAVAPLIWSNPEIQKKYPCYVAAPQLSDELMSYPALHPAKHPGETPNVREWAFMAGVEEKELCQKLLRDFPNIDRNRVYLVGHSMGGGAVLMNMAQDPDLYAAGLDCEGGGDPDYPAIYVAHHANMMIFCRGDNQDALDMGSSINKLGGHVTVVQFLNFDHNMMGESFTLEPGVVDWLFAQHK